MSLPIRKAVSNALRGAVVPSSADDPITVVDTMSMPSLFGGWFTGSSWDPWKAFLKSLFGLEMSSADLEIYKRCTGRTYADGPHRECWVCVGRRGGKSRILALIADLSGLF